MPQTQFQTTSASSPIAARRVGGIAALAAEISAACDGPDTAMKVRIRAALESAVADPDLLSAEHRAPRAECYARHVIYSDPLGRFTVLAIVWGAGQFSPPHAHDTWCAYAVYENALEETLFAIQAGATKANRVCTQPRNPGYSCFAGAGLDQIHKLGNSGAVPAISIHVYGVGRERISSHVNRIVEIGMKEDRL
ncbi:MAG: cysteine dioxygenase family protein [Rhizobiales bacterium]|nr:cysteine dioxygenase family protein [Hyphomicrobiales bacterium]